MSRKHMFVRSTLTIALPFVLIWAFVAELRRGLGSAFRYAWLEVRINVASYRDLMKREEL
jgi:hypothetical protein